MGKKDFPLYTLERLLKKAGAERVSPSAAEELREILVDLVERITEDAVMLARHAKRVTVKREDIRLVAKNL